MGPAVFASGIREVEFASGGEGSEQKFSQLFDF
jgi:hypothetical protein